MSRDASQNNFRSILFFLVITDVLHGGRSAGRGWVQWTMISFSIINALYCCHAWKVATKVTWNLQAFVNTCQRQLLDSTSDEELGRRTGLFHVGDMIGKWKWLWISHNWGRAAIALLATILLYPKKLLLSNWRILGVTTINFHLSALFL